MKALLVLMLVSLAAAAFAVTPSNAAASVAATSSVQGILCAGIAKKDAEGSWQFDSCSGSCGGSSCVEVTSLNGDYRWCGCEGTPPIAPACCYLRIKSDNTLHKGGNCQSCPNGGPSCVVEIDEGLASAECQ